MSALGDLLEAMHDAPRIQCFSGWATNVYEPEMVRRAMERRQERRGVRSTRTTIGFTGTPRPPGPVESLVRFWCDGHRWRLDQDNHRTIGTSEGTFHFTPGQGGILDRWAPRQFMAGMGSFFCPASLLGTLKLTQIDATEFLGRSCWSVRTELREDEPGHRPLFLFGGEDFEFLVDSELGLIVRSEGSVERQFVSRFEMRELSAGQPIPPEVFDFVTPDGSSTRSQGEVMLGHLRDRGIDVSGIDPNDEAAVREAMTPGGRSLPPQPADIELLAAQHIPAGPAPADEDHAREEISQAFRFMGKRSVDGRALVNVQLGDNLGTCQVELEQRFPALASGEGERPVRIKFLSPGEAVVWTPTPIGIREGRAVLVAGHWKVSRATFCSLVAMGGVRCPPPPE